METIGEAYSDHGTKWLIERVIHFTLAEREKRKNKKKSISLF